MGDYNDAFMRNRDAAVQARTKAQNRATVLQLKLIGQSHPTGLTTNLLKLFEARPPLEHKPPPEKRKCLPYTGMAQFVTNFAEPGDAEYSPPVQEAETPTQKKARIHMLQLEKGATKAAEELQKYDPASDPNISGDPYKTLFVARLNYETTEHRIKREFEAYGPIKRVGISEHPQGERLRLLTFLNSVRMIADKVSNKPRGYAFIEYMHTRDMKAAYKQADGRKLDNKRVLVDVERGRTVPNWRPRRLGGGLGSTRVGGEEVNQRYSGREPQQIALGGPPRSEEPRAREDRVVDRVREKSRERGRDRELEREKSRERSHDRTRDRDSREERPHRDRDRTRDRDREKDRGRDRDRTRDRDRDRDRGRDYDRDRDRERDRDRGRDRPRERERDYERGETDLDRGHSRDRGSEHDRVESKHERNRHGEREREYDHVEPEHDHELYEESGHGHGYGYVKKEPEDYEDHHEHHQGLDTDVGPDRYDQKPERDYGRYVKMEPEDFQDHEHNQGLDTQSGPDRYDHDQDLERDYGRYIKTEPEDYQDDRTDSESRQRERTRDQKRQYMRSERSLSREDEH